MQKDETLNRHDRRKNKLALRFNTTIQECPLCHEPIETSAGQRVYGCGKCRKGIREHNRKYVKRNKFNPETSKVQIVETK